MLRNGSTFSTPYTSELHLGGILIGGVRTLCSLVMSTDVCRAANFSDGRHALLNIVMLDGVKVDLRFAPILFKGDVQKAQRRQHGPCSKAN